MIIAVTGGRDYRRREHVFQTLDSVRTHFGVTSVVQGGAKGADLLCAAWAIDRGIPVFAVAANWDEDEKAAGPIRNAFMLDYFCPALLVAFPGGRGTGSMIKLATARGVPVYHG